MSRAWLFRRRTRTAHGSAPEPAGTSKARGPSARAVPLCVVALLRPPRQPGANVPARARLRGVLAPPERAPRIVVLPATAPAVMGSRLVPVLVPVPLWWRD